MGVIFHPRKVAAGFSKVSCLHLVFRLARFSLRVEFYNFFLVKMAVQSLSHNLLIDNSGCVNFGMWCDIWAWRGKFFSNGSVPLFVDVICRPSGIRIRIFSAVFLLSNVVTFGTKCPVQPVSGIMNWGGVQACVGKK